MIAPKPALVISAKDDEWMPIRGAEEAYEKARKIYSKKRAENKLEMRISEGKHGFDREVWNGVYSWISKNL